MVRPHLFSILHTSIKHRSASLARVHQPAHYVRRVHYYDLMRCPAADLMGELGKIKIMNAGAVDTYSPFLDKVEHEVGLTLADALHQQQVLSLQHTCAYAPRSLPNVAQDLHGSSPNQLSPCRASRRPRAMARQPLWVRVAPSRGAHLVGGRW